MKKAHAIMYVLVSLSLFIATAFCSTPAFALSYTMGPVEITAELDESGTLSVTENRTYSFADTSNGVYWKIPEGEQNGRMVSPKIVSCALLSSAGSAEPFARIGGGAPHTCEVTHVDGAYDVKLYNPASGSVTYQISYVLPGVATRFSDIAELYWKFVSDGWDQTSNDVSCTILLPLHSGDNIKAEVNTWVFGHGALDATVKVNDSGAVYHVPHVSPDAFAEARLLFPASWISKAPLTDNEHLSQALSEEDAWARTADATRMWTNILFWGTFALLLAIGLGACISAFRTYLRYKQVFKPTFQERYFRDVPSKDHPAVLGCLYHGEHAGEPEMSGTIMRLVDAHVLEFEAQQKSETFMVNQEQLISLTDPLDLQFARDVLRLEGREHFSLEELAAYAKEHPESYKNAVDEWIGAVWAQGISRGFYTSQKKLGKGPLILWLVLSSVLLVAGACILYTFGSEWPFYFVLASPAIGIVVSALTLARTPQRSSEAIELNAKLHALKRWLLEFTQLKEAVPHDVVLWNRLLVMAVVLGVSQQVLEQIKVSAPELLRNTDFIYYYPWMWGYGPRHLFFSQISNGVYHSYRATVASVAASAAASRGSGGGFSSGGGGGFGGGGGGGAF